MKEVKKSAVKFLSKYGITKDDPEFKEVFGFVYRGASFALVSLCTRLGSLLGPWNAFHGVYWTLTILIFTQRTCIRSEVISTNLIDKCADMHARMYVRGDGSVVK
jgi:hypothetical protein